MDNQNLARLPESFRPLMWSDRFEDVDPEKHKEEIIVNTINYGNLKHWGWIMAQYGKDEIRQILERRLVTEFNPESKNLAQLIFSVTHFRDVRGSAY